MAESGLVLNSRYRLDERIAAGGMGEVWQGIDLLLKRPVAVKLIRPDHAPRAEGVARFRAESRHAASLAHPNIVQVFDYSEPDPPDPGYLVMEFIDGQSLAQRLEQGPLDPAATMDVVAQAAHGLQAAHQAGLVHRDIKPPNLMLGRSGLIKVTDFGIAYAVGSMPVTQAGVVMGTPAYLAPERAVGAPATPASDLYALGVVAYQCLTGRVPFTGEPLAVALAHVEGDIPPLPPSVPADVAALVADLTAREPSARPAPAAEVAARAEHLRAMLSQPAVLSHPTALSWPAELAMPAAAASTLSTGSPMDGGTFAPAAAGPPTLNLSSQARQPAEAGAPSHSGRSGKTRVGGGLPGPLRVALPIGGLAAAALIGWLVITNTGSGSTPQRSSAPPAAATSPRATSPSAAAGQRSHAGTHLAVSQGGRGRGTPARAGSAGSPAQVPSGPPSTPTPPVQPSAPGTPAAPSVTPTAPAPTPTAPAKPPGKPPGKPTAPPGKPTSGPGSQSVVAGSTAAPPA